MPEVRQEVIVATAVIFSALVAYIGFQSLYPAQNPAAFEKQKEPFSPKKATVPKAKEEIKAEPKVAPNKSTLEGESFRGKILEK